MALAAQWEIVKSDEKPADDDPFPEKPKSRHGRVVTSPNSKSHKCGFELEYKLVQ